MVYVLLPPGHGGYIPFFEVPCENLIGETVLWIIYLSLSPLSCKFVPWTCCPLEVDNSTLTVNAELDCNEAGAVYASTAFWTMNALSILGLILSVGNLGLCAAQLMGHDVVEKTDILGPMSYDLPQVALQILDELNLEDVKKTGQLNYVKKKVNEFLLHKLAKEEKKKLIKDGLKGKRVNMEERKQEMEEIYENLNNGTVKRRKRNVRVRIPTLSGFVRGGDAPRPDRCLRNEVLVDGEDECYQVLTQGPCEEDELVLINPKTRRGYCAPRLCPLDKVFIFSDQLCHDPRELGLCPPGRMLFSSGYGAPVCGCPDGTYEEEDDPDENVCEPVLGPRECGPGKVFWFSDFKRPPRCVADPCGGENGRRGERDLPYVPALHDGKCYRIGSRPIFCKPDEFYSISFELLRGVCTTLEDAGYTILDDDGATNKAGFGRFGLRDSDSGRFGLRGSDSGRFGGDRTGNKGDLDRDRDRDRAGNKGDSDRDRERDRAGNKVESGRFGGDRERDEADSGRFGGDRDRDRDRDRAGNKADSGRFGGDNDRNEADSGRFGEDNDRDEANSGRFGGDGATKKADSGRFGNRKSDSDSDRESDRETDRDEDRAANKAEFGRFGPQKPNRKFITPAGTTLLVPKIGSSVVEPRFSFHPLFLGGSVMPAVEEAGEATGDDENEVESALSGTRSGLQGLIPSYPTAFSPSMINVNGSLTFYSLFDGVLSRSLRSPRSPRSPLLSRSIRSPLPFASPGNVFEPGLSACRAGARRDGNAKCRETVLPSRFPPAKPRPRRSVPPVPPKPACPAGSFRGLDRRCTKRATGIASTINALGLG